MTDKASEFITRMKAARHLLRDAADQLVAGAATAEEAAELFAQAGGEHSREHMTRAAVTARELTNAVAGVAAIADAAIAQARQAKGPTAEGDFGAQPLDRITSIERGSFDQDQSSAAYDPRVRDERRVAALRKFGWPKNRAGRTKAQGMLYNRRGEPVLRQPLNALSGDRVFPASDLKEPWRSDRDMKTTWHIEGGAAAYMRSTKTREMALWLNVQPCGGPYRPDTKGCEENLPKILPKGYILHVHVEKENGQYRHFEYHGTGEALM